MQRVEQITNACCGPYISPLHFREPQLTAFDHADKLPNVSINFLHVRQPKLRLADLV